MGKVALKKAGAAATQSMVRDLLPFLDERFVSLQEQLKTVQDSLQQQIRITQDHIRSVEGQVISLREDMLDRYERQLHLINETNQRINDVHNEVVHLGGKMEGYMEAMRLAFGPVKPKRRVG